jgi:hypothetical protein
MRIDPIHWISTCIEVLVQGRRNLRLTVFWVAGEEATGLRIVVSGAEVVEAQVGVVLFAAIELSQS